MDYSDSMSDFVEFLNDDGLLDIEMTGHLFALSNRQRGDHLIQVKLVKFLIFSNWDIINHTNLVALSIIGSDHNPFLLNWMNRTHKGPYSFKYEIIWVSHLEFRDWISNWWNIPIQGFVMFRLVQKLLNIKNRVKGWNRVSFSNVLE